MKRLFLIMGLVLLSSFNSFKESKYFEVNIKIVKNKVVISDTKGFTFYTMAFTKKNVFFNESGMINEKLPEEIENSDFVFKITRKNNKIILRGIKNTNWKELEFQNTAIINQDGIK